MLDLKIFTRRSIQYGAKYTYDYFGEQMLVEGTVAGQAFPAVIARRVCPAAVDVVQFLPAPVAEQVFPAADVVTVPADSTDAGLPGAASTSASGSGEAVETIEVDGVDGALFEAETQAWLEQATLSPRSPADDYILSSAVATFELGPVFPGSPPPNWKPW